MTSDEGNQKVKMAVACHVSAVFCQYVLKLVSEERTQKTPCIFPRPSSLVPRSFI
ncbi:hypothetical protein MNBD_GAMMA25-2081 [hydrothermal vent metagenome]|uniref:Uncharacterized protein n=1 Tax=hydrothermal vent metagenome TaxID=652676 RepID=A0A3B1BDH6_9ZZZZ